MQDLRKQIKSGQASRGSRASPTFPTWSPPQWTWGIASFCKIIRVASCIQSPLCPVLEHPSAGCLLTPALKPAHSSLPLIFQDWIEMPSEDLVQAHVSQRRTVVWKVLKPNAGWTLGSSWRKVTTQRRHSSELFYAPNVPFFCWAAGTALELWLSQSESSPKSKTWATHSSFPPQIFLLSDT